MKKIFNLLLFSTLISNAQVGIGTTSPQAAFHIDSTTDGLLIPNVALTNTTTATIITPTTSELIYNTATTGDVTPGYYYWETTPTVASNRWIRLASTLNNNWSLTGNAGTTPGTNFIGTTDNTDIRFKTGVASTDRWNISHTNNGQLQSYSLGTAALPTYSWQPDTNTGIWSPLADNIAVSTAGLERTRILANGDMGIGTTVPSHRLSVKNDIANAGVMCIENANSAGFTGTYFSEGPFPTNYRGHIGHVNSTSILGGQGIFQIASGDRDMVFSATNGSNSYSEQVRIENTTGNVGINTNLLGLPTSKLQVNGSLAIGIVKITASTDLTTLANGVSKVVINNAGANIIIDLPAPSTCTGRLISFTRGESSTGTITLDPAGGNQIQGLAGSLGGTTSIPAHSVLGAGVNIQFWSDGVNWYR